MMQTWGGIDMPTVEINQADPGDLITALNDPAIADSRVKLEQMTFSQTFLITPGWQLVLRVASESKA
jgi:hypothetical protein